MSSHLLPRRAWLMAPLFALSGCQIPEVRLRATVQPEAVRDFVSALHAFGRDEGYRLVDRRPGETSNEQNFELDGWRSKIICWGGLRGGPAADYTLSVRHKDDLWLLVVPDADLSEIAEKLRLALNGREGIAVENDI